MSKFLKDIHYEIEVRISSYQKEREALAKAAERVVELDTLIAEAQAELAEFSKRLPKEEKKDDVPKDTGP